MFTLKYLKYQKQNANWVVDCMGVEFGKDILVTEVDLRLICLEMTIKPLE